jgi:hypothetical protein
VRGVDDDAGRGVAWAGAPGQRVVRAWTWTSGSCLARARAPGPCGMVTDSDVPVT